MEQPKGITHVLCHLVKDKCLVFLIFVVFLGAFFFQTHSASAASFSTTTSHAPQTGYCANEDGHCYSEVWWLRNTGGAYTLIDPYGPMSCYGCGVGGFIDNEMWYEDNVSNQCIHSAFQACWVESGVSTWPASYANSCNQGTDSTCLFWADYRVINGSGNYHEHSMYNFGPDGTDLNPYLIYVEITNARCCGSQGNTWQVRDVIYTNSVLTTVITPPPSTNNSMNPNKIIVGSELADPNGSASDNYMTQNEWLDSSGTWHYQTTSGNGNRVDSPPYGGWSTNPCNCSGNVGGYWLTYD